MNRTGNHGTIFWTKDLESFQLKQSCIPGTPRPIIYKWLAINWMIPNLYFNKWLEITNHLFINGCLGLQVFISTCFRFLVKSYKSRSMIPQSQFVVWRGFIVFLVFLGRIFFWSPRSRTKKYPREEEHSLLKKFNPQHGLWDLQVFFFKIFFPPKKVGAVKTGVILAWCKNFTHFGGKKLDAIFFFWKFCPWKNWCMKFGARCHIIWSN